ncbi:molybdenum cofactor guanylyltransferase MobA [Enterovibrio norvegicus]|uniref:molybdenum cofactor guanylyltransferase MobA n=1 Tax=Enterovibrio norvegicus TaxID=188144 RepID=UPI000C82C4E6|nr:molybdenum cofactor guanylyltransferase MobA [Enterovibrio norvegicus]PML80952.1 molybdenum cofactor guanylyltransferase MobA [Enterovibrio norvegicus]PMN67482.1 molybdenum cofactor guanylyltransferase MobA [Enterovibrio norvegicus]
MPSHPDITWVILAGGQARRMGGQDKGLVTLNGKPFIEFVHERLTEQGATIAINANRNQERYEQYGPVFGDVLEGFPGPLGGMHAAMSNIDSEWLGFVPCDCPNLPHALLEKMYHAISADAEIVVAHDGESVQPVVTMMKRSIFERLNTFLANGDRKIVLLYDLCNTVFVDFSAEHDAFINLNTPDELSRYGELS